jgi:Toprim-like
VHLFSKTNEVQRIMQNAVYLPPTSKRKNMLLGVYPLTSPTLLEYANSRGISQKVARYWAMCIQYLAPNDYKYFGLGMRNNAEGYEVRSSKFAGCVGEKTFTFFQSTARGHQLLSVFEGLFDFLSYCEIKKVYSRDNLASDILILHSVSTLQHFDYSNYEVFNLFLDNDKAGEKATEYFYENHSDKLILDFSKALYPNSKDLNDYLVCQKVKK